MAQLTKSQLVQQLEAAHVSYQVLEQRYEAAKAELAALNKRTTAQRWVRRYPTAEQLAAHDEYARALIAAREEAVRTGRAVRVQR